MSDYTRRHAGSFRVRPPGYTGRHRAYPSQASPSPASPGGDGLACPACAGTGVNIVGLECVRCTGTGLPDFRLAQP
jgi:hypothetical protein